MVIICCILFPFHYPSSQVLLIISLLQGTNVMTPKSSKSKYTNSFFSKSYLCNWNCQLMVSIITFGQSPKELIFLCDRTKGKCCKPWRCTNNDKRQLGGKGISVLLLRRADDKYTTFGRKVGALRKVSIIIPTSGIWYRRSEVKRQGGREERLQRTKKQKQSETMKKHALHWSYKVAKIQPKKLPRINVTPSLGAFISKYFRNHKNECRKKKKVLLFSNFEALKVSYEWSHFQDCWDLVIHNSQGNSKSTLQLVHLKLWSRDCHSHSTCLLNYIPLDRVLSSSHQCPLSIRCVCVHICAYVYFLPSEPLLMLFLLLSGLILCSSHGFSFSCYSF